MNLYKKNSKYSKGLPADHYQKEYTIAEDYMKTNPAGKEVADLKNTIIGGFNIGFLIRGINDGALTVTYISRAGHDLYTEHELLFKEPVLGEFTA